MRLLFLTRSFPPHHTARSIQIARLVENLDHPIRVVCCDEEWRLDETIAPGIKTKLAGIHRVAFRPNGGPCARIERAIQNRLRLPDPYRRWALEAASVIVEETFLEASDLLVTFGEPMSDHLAGLALKHRSGIPWIAHFSDPWVDNPFRPHNRLSRILNGRMERRVVSGADALVFTSRETVKLVMAKYPPAWRAKAHVLPHAFDEQLYPKTSTSPAHEGLRLCYLGNFYGARLPRSLFRALALIRAGSPERLEGVRVELIGRGTETLPMLEEFHELPQGLIETRPPVSYRESLALMKSADLLLVIDAPAAKSVFLPSKLVDYIGARRPIFGITPPGAAADVIERLGGWVAAPDDPAAIAKELSGVIDALRTRGCEESWGDEEVRARFVARTVGRQMARIIDTVIEEREHRADEQSSRRLNPVDAIPQRSVDG